MRFQFAVALSFVTILGHAQSIESQPLQIDRALEEEPVVRFKKQALQSVSLSGGMLQDVSGDGLSGRYLEASIGSGIPLGSFQNLLGVRPGVRVDWFESGASVEVPRQLYQFEIQFFYRKAIRDRLSAMAIVSPSIRSDLTTGDNAFRVFALALINWETVPDRLMLSFGAVYLGRADLPVVPAIGLRWTPDRFTRLDLQFPTSRFSRRLAKDGARSETWAYLSGGLGGNTWAVTRANTTTDELSIRDFRILLGVEKTKSGGGGWFADFGFATGRRVEFESTGEQMDLGDAVIANAGWRY